jgi:hypothetical protein
MKKQILNAMLLAACIFTVSCSSEKPTEESGSTTAIGADSIATKPITSIAFADSLHDFGTLNEGEKATYTFKYTNTGENPLVLEDVRASCGCTLPEWTKDEIAPGAEGLIKVVYNSEGRPGEFKKTITVIANTQAEVSLLTIMGKVTPKKLDVQGPFKDQQ